LLVQVYFFQVIGESTQVIGKSTNIVFPPFSCCSMLLI